MSFSITLIAVAHQNLSCRQDAATVAQAKLDAAATARR